MGDLYGLNTDKNEELLSLDSLSYVNT